MQDQTGSSTLAVLAARLCYRDDLSAEDRAAILELPFTLKITELHQYVVREREPTTHSCIMLSGFSVRSKIVGSGDRQILAIHMKGDAVDLQNSLLEVSDHSVHMLTAGKVAMIPREAILALTLDRPRIAQAMWLDTLVDGSVFREWITNVGRRQARSRIAHLFCEFSLRLKPAGLGENKFYELPMTPSSWRTRLV